jgi:hypothetical protein
VAKKLIAQWPGLKIPTANHGLPEPVLRINSIGLSQVVGGTGESLSLIWKSPVGDNVTPVNVVSLSVGDDAGPQNSEANTDKAGVGGARPAFSPPPRINPCPLTVILPFVLTVAPS